MSPPDGSGRSRGYGLSEWQIIALWREQEAVVAAASVCRRPRVGSATFYKRVVGLGDLHVLDGRRLKRLRDERGRLRRISAEATPVDTSPKIRRDEVGKPAARHEAKDHLTMTFQMGQRRACVPGDRCGSGER